MDGKPARRTYNPKQRLGPKFKDRKPTKDHKHRSSSRPGKHASKFKKEKKEDYKKLVITTLLKVLKKMKAFAVRKYLRSAKMVAEGDERYHGKETQEELEQIAESLKQVKNNDVKAVIPLLTLIETKEDLSKYWPVLETMKVTTKAAYNGLLKKYISEAEERGVTIESEELPTFGEESDEPSEGLIAFLFYLLVKKPTQYKQALQTISELLEKVKAKIEKTKSVRVDKKTKVKEKMEQGEYLPKDVYEAARKEKLEKRAKAQEERKKEKAKEPKPEGEEETEETGEKKKFDKKRGRPDRVDKPFKKDFKKGEDGFKPKWNKDKSASSFGDKGKRNAPAYEDKKYQNDKIKQFKNQKANEPQAPANLHPSWEAKKQQLERDTHIKFVQNKVFEF